MRRFLLSAAALAVVAGFSATLQPAKAQPYGYGMMGPGYGSGYMMGPGMMGGYGSGYMMGPGMMGGYGPGYMMGPGHGHGWMMGPGMMGGYGSGGMHGYGPGMMGYGHYGTQGNLNLTTDQVKKNLEQMIRNPNLKVGEVKQKNDDTIVADIVTKDKDVLVQRLQVNRRNGFFQSEQ